MMERCELCRFWLPTIDHPEEGECHRLPPTMRGTATLGSFPIILHEDWCGEFVGREQMESSDD